MNSRLNRTGWSYSSRPAAVVAEAFFTRRTFLVSAEPGPNRDRFAKECVAAAIGKRVLIFAPDEAAAEPIRSRLMREIATRTALAERDRSSVAKRAAERKLIDAERELAALRATSTVKPGFFARLFGTSGPTQLIATRISEWEATRVMAEAEIRRLDGRIHDESGDSRNSTHREPPSPLLSSDHFTDVSTTTPFPIPPDETLLASMTAVFASPAFDPATICIATPADLPFSGPSADLAITLAAERVTAGEFAAVIAMAPNQIVIGDPAPAISNSPYRNGVPTEFRSDFFAEQWSNARQSAWTKEGDRIVCRLEPVSQSERRQLKCEPLIDRPEIELRFATNDGDTLVEVAFPTKGTAAQARAWLAAELGESRPVARGPAEWKIGEVIRAVWSEAESVAGEWIESVPGVREFVVGTDVDALTAEMRFDPNVGWTRESAEAWLNEKLALSVPPTVVLATSNISEPTVEFATAG